MSLPESVEDVIPRILGKRGRPADNHGNHRMDVTRITVSLRSSEIQLSVNSLICNAEEGSYQVR